ncbi:hypothetical protein LAZ67_8001972 [Cordylochernes scorpioides]|uniref:Integrase catalytic domain-containing protein n=1 Tax=Cordylochernes scorpioides TaxID=51811 RepID=A0ABY6KQP0_9ARAC|nr:hypothetical protein LAZ67_8001972 [Cordylochernes scorpioides]
MPLLPQRQDLHSYLNRLKTILECLKTAGLTLNASKCRFAYTKLLILGHVVSNEGIAPDPEKIISIRKFPTPRTVKDVRAFLGLCSYYRIFIREFSKVALPLQILTRKNHSFAWGKEQELSFNSLKNKLISPEVVTHYDPNKPIGLHTDASDQGLGAVLVHLDENTKERPISYASRTLQKAGTNYSTTEKECLAIIWAIKKFRPYLYGRKFTIYTNHHKNWNRFDGEIPEIWKRKLLDPGMHRLLLHIYRDSGITSRDGGRNCRLFLQKVVLRHGASKTVISDRGSCFLSKLFKEVLKICNTLHKKTTSYHPQTNGQTERMNRTLADMMAMYIDERHQNFDEILPFVTFAYNSSIQDTTGYSPYFLIHGREPLTFLDSTFDMPELSKHKDYDEYNKSKQLYDRTHREVKYAINDLVLIWTPIRKVGRADKLQRRYVGSYQILRQTSPVNYEVIEIAEGKRKKRQIVHVTIMKPCRSPDLRTSLFQEGKQRSVIKFVLKSGDISAATIHSERPLVYGNKTLDRSTIP